MLTYEAAVQIMRAEIAEPYRDGEPTDDLERAYERGMLAAARLIEPLGDDATAGFAAARIESRVSDRHLTRLRGLAQRQLQTERQAAQPHLLTQAGLLAAPAPVAPAAPAGFVWAQFGDPRSADDRWYEDGHITDHKLESMSLIWPHQHNAPWLRAGVWVGWLRRVA